MSAAKVNGTTITQLDGKAGPEEVVNEDDVKDASKLAKMLARVLATVAGLRRQWAPRRMYFQDIATTGAAGASVNHSLQHSFGGRVNWWVCGWGIYGDTAPVVCCDDTVTTSETLVLSSFATGTMTICVEEAG